MIDRSLINRLEILAKKEKTAKEFKSRLRVKGILTAKSLTKKQNLVIIVNRDSVEHKLVIPKSHKEKYALAEKLPIGSTISVEGSRKLRMIICTKLKVLQYFDQSKQTTLWP